MMRYAVTREQLKPQIQLNSALLPACHDLTLVLGQAKGSAGQETAPEEDAPTSSSSASPLAGPEKCES